MITRLTDSQLGTLTPMPTQLQQAWHLLSLLLTIGRPARPSQLSTRCTSFPASPQLVQSLCFIPRSPLFLTSNLFVTPSRAALQFALTSSSIRALLPRIFWASQFSDFDLIICFRKRKELPLLSRLLPLPKRRLVLPSANESEKNGVALSSEIRIRFRNACIEVHVCVDSDISKNMNVLPGNMSDMTTDSRISSKLMAITPLIENSKAGSFSSGLENIEPMKAKKKRDVYVNTKLHTHGCPLECLPRLNSYLDIPLTIPAKRVTTCEHDQQQAVPSFRMENPVLGSEAPMGGRINFNDACCLEKAIELSISPAKTSNPTGTVTNLKVVENAKINQRKEGESSPDPGREESDKIQLFQSFSTAPVETMPRNDFRRINMMSYNDAMAALDREPTTMHVKRPSLLPEAEPSIALKKLAKIPANVKMVQRDALNPRLPALRKSLDCSKPIATSKEMQQFKTIHKRQKLKQHDYTYIKEKKENSFSISSKNQLEPKVLPKFDDFIVDEEEGSGGYGTVYKARRKTDGMTFAIKCPHANAHRHHVINELRMLERFGGKNFIIKYEGSFKIGNQNYCVLEHFDHDRPEVLKREINVLQFQWYGYCMFRALASLHNEGIVHRDVKPGNFLFSRKVNKGYLIDFNLAMDIHQKYGTIDKSKEGHDINLNQMAVPHAKFVSPTQSRKLQSTKSLETVKWDKMKGSKLTVEAKNVKKKAVRQTKNCIDIGSQNIIKSQGADGSGITSTKDNTSGKTPLSERPREPLPCQGRKELISLAQEAMQKPNHEASRVPASKRKRVAAPRKEGKVDKKLVHITPMPLNATGFAVAGAGSSKNKGDGKHKKEGPCVGTKGFRAPEVLLRSPHQGLKVDIWSAGVTLLYLMVGRMPFTGDNPQNMKEIVKLRGSEDLWELSKLHNRESSFPVDLLDSRFLPSTALREWCKMSTRRPESLEAVPSSLFDLVDKCLTVNPRLRVSADEALRHEFFAPCHEAQLKN